MILLKRFIFFLLFLTILGRWSIASIVGTVKIKQVTFSKSSIIINKGDINGVKKGDRARLLYSKEIGRTKMHDVAKAVCVKVKEDDSYWVLSEVNHHEYLKKELDLIFIPQLALSKGRQAIQVRGRKIILTRDTTKADYILNNEDGYPKSLSRRGDEYLAGRKVLVRTKVDSAYDHEKVTYDNWNLVGKEYSEDYLKPVMTYTTDVSGQEFDLRKVQRKNLDEISDSVVTSTIERSGHFKYSRDGIDHRSRKEREFSVPNVYKLITQKAEDQQASRMDYWALERIKEDPELWSVDMDDDHLRRFLIDSGIVEERRRQRRALELRLGHDVTMLYAGTYSNGVSYGDPHNQSQDSGLSLSYEFHLGNMSDTLLRWGVVFDYSKTVSYYFDGDQNIKSEENIYGAGLNWYVYNYPGSINEFIWFLGAMFKGGSAHATSAYIDESYRYSLWSIPEYHGGVKYRFNFGDEFDQYLNFGMGLNFQLTYEQKVLTGTNIPSDSNMSNTLEAEKMGFSFGVIFSF